MFRRMNTVIDTMESLLIEAQKTKGWRWVDEEPMWLTWSLEKFGKGVYAVMLPTIQPPHQSRHLPVYCHPIIDP